MSTALACERPAFAGYLTRLARAACATFERSEREARGGRDWRNAAADAWWLPLAPSGSSPKKDFDVDANCRDFNEITWGGFLKLVGLRFREGASCVPLADFIRVGWRRSGTGLIRIFTLRSSFMDATFKNSFLGIV